MASSKALARTTTQPGSRHRAIPAYLPYRYSTSFFAKRATLVELLGQNGQLAVGTGRVCARIALHFFPTPLHLSYLPFRWG